MPLFAFGKKELLKYEFCHIVVLPKLDPDYYAPKHRISSITTKFSKKQTNVVNSKSKMSKQEKSRKQSKKSMVFTQSKEVKARLEPVGLFIMDDTLDPDESLSMWLDRTLFHMFHLFAKRIKRLSLETLLLGNWKKVYIKVGQM